MKALRSARFLVLLAALFSMVTAVGLLLAAPAPPRAGGSGAVLALRSALRGLSLPAAHPKTFQSFGVPTDLRRASDGRYVYNKRTLMRSGALRSRAAAATAQVDEAVQTFDVFNPPPGFAATALTPTNLTPVWTADETMLVFSSNRKSDGTAGTRFHIWAIPINGGAPVQLTDSTAIAGESAVAAHGEFFPALSPNNNQTLAFTSDANSANVQNLYSLPFKATTVTINGLASPTLRGADSSGNPVSGFSGVGRPAFSPANADEIVFSALSVTGANAGHRHLYFLYLTTGGYSSTSLSLPAKLTDGPADDTDPAYSQDGQYLAFASTAASVAATGQAPGPNPDTAPLKTTVAAGTTSLSNRAILLVTGAGGLANGGQPVTLAGTDNFAPAWSPTRRNPYLNPAPGAEYIAFSRGADQTSPHDIYYLQLLQNVEAGGQTSRSNETSTTPLVAADPVYQVNAGDTTAGDIFGGYVADTHLGPSLTTPFLVNGGTADGPATPPTVISTVNDPGTPAGIYQTDRSGTFTYTFPNLTPFAKYHVRLHMADTKESVAGKRIFKIITYDARLGTVSEPNIDIVGQALLSPGHIDGLVTDAATGQPIAVPATITVTDATGTAVTTTPSPLVTTAAIADPGGTTSPVNYNGALLQGSYLVTVSAAGYGSVSENVTVNSSAYTRADFVLGPTAGAEALSGTVKDTAGNPISGVAVTVTDTVTGAALTQTGTTDASGNYGPISVSAPANYNVTATPPAGSGYTTQTQTLAVVAGTPPTLAFVLQSATSPTVGTLGGLVTNSATLAPVAGATITVKGAGGAIVAILTTGSALTSPAAPNGDGKPVNYLANLPVGTYTLQFSDPGYAPQTQQVVVANDVAKAVAFVRADKALVTSALTVGVNTAIVVEYDITVPNSSTTDKNGLIIAPAGAITLAFTPVSGDPPIVQGIEILADSAAAQSSGFGSLANPTSSGGSSAPPVVEAIGGSATTAGAGGQTTTAPVVNLYLFSNGSGLPVSYNIYRSPGVPHTSNNPTLTGTGSEAGTPYATVTADGSASQIFTDTNVAYRSQYYYQATALYQEVLAPESTGNAVVQLNTDDAANAYDDTYPTWSPFLSVFSIAYSSNRTVTYTAPGTGAASETAISVGRSGALGSGGTVGASYAGILESQVLNLDPPTLLPYSGNEIIHVNDAAGNTTRTGITPGQPATFTVRLSSREAGIDDSNIYLQIKDPDSKYQDAQGLEHKVFARDTQYRYQRNNPLGPNYDSGSSAYLMNGGSPYDLQFVTQISSLLTYYGFNQFSIGGRNYAAPQRGAVGGVEGAESGVGGGAAPGPDSNRSDSISVGIDGGGINSQPVLDGNGKPVLDANKNPIFLPGTDPALFIPTGPEYECQVVNPAFAGADTVPTDYSTPYWLAGVDDQQPYSADTSKLRPGTEWLKLTRLPDAQQDGQGGLLYGVTWKTPVSASDYYLDVIAFDKAVAPPISAIGGGGNWRIYDNVWGFSTSASVGSSDILVVSDYALGQKFATTTFGGQRGLLNLVPKLYGAESYVTDIDDSLLPNAVYKWAVAPGADGNNPQAEVLRLGDAYELTGPDEGSRYDSSNPNFAVAPPPGRNGLGVNSYYDRFIDDGGTRDNAPAVRSQSYSLWRTLARGPVPSTLYTAYEPKLETQPVVNDPGAATPVKVPQGTVANATRCILWISPFTGDVLAGPGTLIDPNTQTALRAFVAAGGRLCVSGQDVASALTQGGTVNNAAGGFLSDVLGATLKSANQGTHLPAGGTDIANNRITYMPSFDGTLQGAYQELTPGLLTTPIAPSQRPIRISNNYGGNIFEAAFVPDIGLLGNWRTDGSLDQLGPYIQGFPEQANNTNSVVGQIDTVTPNTGPNIHTDITLGSFTNTIGQVDNGNVNAANSPGGIGLIYSESPLTTTGGTGSKVVYATFGLEALSTEYYKQISSFKPNPVIFLARNQRQNILHNIVSYLRTGSILGTIRTTTGNGAVGSGIPGVTVYVQAAYGTAIPGRGTFSATSDAAGNYSINGLEPGNYTLVAYKTGYNRAVSNPGTVLTIEGDVTIQGANLTLSPASPGIITGTVSDTGGKAIAGANVLFTSSDGLTQQTTTDTSGKYTLSSVPQGTYTGTASAAGATATTPDPVGVAGNTTVTVNFTLAPGPGIATGRVVDINGDPIPGATVFYSGGGLTAPASGTTDATGTYTLSTLPPATYTVTASKTGFGNSTPIQVTVSTGTTVSAPDIILGPVSNGTLGGLVTAAGSATPLAGVTVTVVNTASNQSVTVTTGGTSSPGADGSPINYSLTLGQGTYTVTAALSGVTTVSQTVTITGTGFVRVDFAGTGGLPSVHTFPSGLQFVSFPFDYSSLGFDALFGTLNTAAAGAAPNGNRTHVAVWNPATLSYALDPAAPADRPRPGIGYWVYLKNAFQVGQAGTTLTGTVPVTLTPRWNQIGVPSLTGIAVSKLTVTVSGKTLSFADASGSSFHAVSGVLYRYDGTSYQRVLSTDTLQPWTAYWILAYTPVTLNIPTK